MKLQEKTLWKNIKSGEFMPVYLLTGSENYLKQKYASLLVEKAVPKGMEAFNVHRLNGDTMTMDDLVTAVQALPAMSPRTCVLVHDLDIAGLKDVDKDILLDLCENPYDTCTLILWQDTKGFPRNTKKMKALYQAIDRSGAVVELNQRARPDLIRFLSGTFQKNGCSIDRSTAEYLIDCVGEDMSALTNEAEKLSSYADGKVTKADVDAVCVKSLEATAFQMVDALMARNYDRVFETIAILFEQRVEPMMILGALISTYSDIYRVKVVVNAGGQPNDLKKDFPQAYRSDFKLRNAARRSKNFSVRALRRSLEILAGADTALKSTSQDPRTVFEKLMIELGMARKGRA